MPKPQKVVQYCKLCFELLSRGQSTLQELHVVCGGFVYVAMFRRAWLSSLDNVFQHMQAFEQETSVVRLPLPYLVKVEIARFILLTPLVQMDFHSEVDGEVTCSDASNVGGGMTWHPRLGHTAGQCRCGAQTMSTDVSPWPMPHKH